MKKELTGYVVVFMKKEETPLVLSVKEGEALKSALAQGDTFIDLTSKNIMIRANTIDRIVGQYKKLEEKCMSCGTLKPIGSKCQKGCDDRKVVDLSRLKEKMFSVRLPHVSETKQETNCKTCDVLTTNGEYCDECAKVYG